MAAGRTLRAVVDSARLPWMWASTRFPAPVPAARAYASARVPGPASGGGGAAAATVVGKVVAERAKTAGVTKVAFDRSGFKYHGRVKALAEAAREGGLDF